MQPQSTWRFNFQVSQQIRPLTYMCYLLRLFSSINYRLFTGTFGSLCCPAMDLAVVIAESAAQSSEPVPLGVCLSLTPSCEIRWGMSLCELTSSSVMTELYSTNSCTNSFHPSAPLILFLQERYGNYKEIDESLELGR